MGRPPQFLLLLVDDESVGRMAMTAGVEEACREFVDAASLNDALDVRRYTHLRPEALHDIAANRAA